MNTPNPQNKPYVMTAYPGGETIVPVAQAIAEQKRYTLELFKVEYDSDDDALWDYVVVNWSTFVDEHEVCQDHDGTLRKVR